MATASRIEYESVPSSWRNGETAFETRRIGREIASSEPFNALVGRCCRKHGVNCILNRLDGSGTAFSYVFFLSLDPDAPADAPADSDDESKRLTDLVNELDNRTPLNFPCVEASGGNRYVEPFTVSYRTLKDYIRYPVREFMNGPFNCRYLYIYVESKYWMVLITDHDLLASGTGGVLERLSRWFFANGYDTVASGARVDTGELGGFVDVSDVVSACKVRIKFGKAPLRDDCSLYVVQKSGGEFTYLLVTRDGLGYSIDSKNFSEFAPTTLIRMYITHVIDGLLKEPRTKKP